MKFMALITEIHGAHVSKLHNTSAGDVGRLISACVLMYWRGMRDKTRIFANSLHDGQYYSWVQEDDCNWGGGGGGGGGGGHLVWLGGGGGGSKSLYIYTCDV